MVNLLMPKATAIWLVDNTSLTFKQISEFCNLHELEVQGIADGEIGKGIAGVDPLANGQLTRDEIARCEANPEAALKLSEEITRYLKQDEKSGKKGASYIPVARRQDKPNAIAWLLKNCPEMRPNHIAKLIGSTKTTIEAIKSRTHWNIQNIKPQDPVLLGLCLQKDLDKTYELAKAKYEKEEGINKPKEITTDDISDIL